MNRLYFFECLISSIACFCLASCSDSTSNSLLRSPPLLPNTTRLFWVVSSVMSLVLEIDRSRLAVDDRIILLFFFYCRICSSKFSLSKATLFFLANSGILFQLTLMVDCWGVLVPHHFFRVPNPSIRVLSHRDRTVCTWRGSSCCLSSILQKSPITQNITTSILAACFRIHRLTQLVSPELLKFIK